MAYGDGSYYRMTYTDKTTGLLKESSRFEIEYWKNGKKHRERTHSSDEKVAKRLLRLRVAEARTGTLLPPDVSKTTYEDLARLIKDDYEANDLRTCDLKIVQARLVKTFAGMRASEITPQRIRAYKADQRRDGYAKATIDRDLAALKRSFRLGLRSDVVAKVPEMELFNANNARTGFFDPIDFRTFLKHLPEDFRALFQIAYITGWRVKSELVTRKWNHVDFVNGRLRLDPGEAKNEEARGFPFTSELKRILLAQRKRANGIEKRLGTVVTSVFFKADGTPIGSYRDVWTAAVEASGIKRLPHDFRRTAVRNLELAGVPRSAAMKMVGHKTESIYHRYAIVDEGMQRDAASKLDALHRIQKKARRLGTSARQRSTSASGGDASQTRGSAQREVRLTQEVPTRSHD